jgi:hypothetical protein
VCPVPSSLPLSPSASKATLPHTPISPLFLNGVVREEAVAGLGSQSQPAPLPHPSQKTPSRPY